MKFKIIKDNFEIKDLIDYEDCAGPVDKKQWKDKRSAKEFARYMLSDNGQLPKELEDILKEYYVGETAILYPEYLTGFGEYEMTNRGPRHHDGLLVGKRYVVGIEAKADEALDNKYLSEYDGTKLRYKNISMNLFNDGPNNHSDIRYQLCSGSMGTLIEAVEKQKEVAIFLVISFLSKDGVKKELVNRNRKDIESFKRALISLGNDQYETPFSKKHNIKFFFKTIEIDLD